MKHCLAFSVAVAGLALAGCSDSDDPVSAAEGSPWIVAMSPAPGHTFMATDRDFVVEFSAAMDQPSVEAAYHVTVAQRPVAGAYSWNSDGTMMSFRPAPPLAPESEVQVHVGAGMRGSTGRGVMMQDGRIMDPFEFMGMMYSPRADFASNGERIYYTAASASGEPITSVMGEDFVGAGLPGYGGMDGVMMGSGMMGGGMMGGGMMDQGGGGHNGMACVTCHGPQGSGGRYLAMGTVRTPNIQYAVLTGQAEPEPDEHAEEEGEEHGHEPYTDDSIKRAVGQGLDPDGESLNSFMPRWSMVEQDLEDLLAFLKTL